LALATHRARIGRSAMSNPRGDAVLPFSQQQTFSYARAYLKAGGVR